MSWTDEIAASVQERRRAAEVEYFGLVGLPEPSEKQRQRILELLSEMGRDPGQLAADAELAAEIVANEKLAAEADGRRAELEKASKDFDDVATRISKVREKLDSEESQANAELSYGKRRYQECLEAARESQRRRIDWRARLGHERPTGTVRFGVDREGIDEQVPGVVQPLMGSGAVAL
jgi:hypothetical protein